MNAKEFSEKMIAAINNECKSAADCDKIISRYVWPLEIRGVHEEDKSYIQNIYAAALNKRMLLSKTDLG